MQSVKTEKGTLLPLINLKGKNYLMVAHRLQWLAESKDKYIIETEIKEQTQDSATVRAIVAVLDEGGKIVRKATATKVENKAHFLDFVEKAETAAIGRALAMLGFGTQHALADLDEGERLADSPVASPKKASVKGDF